MKPKHQRLIFVAVSMIFLCLSVVLTLRSFKDNLVFFYSPSDIAAQPTAPSQRIRVGGLVENGSIKRDGETLEFVITDGQSSVKVSFKGMPPALFREGQGAVVEGTLIDKTHLRASQLLTKHDENYMPKEVVDALKRTGRWQEQKE